MQTVIYEASGLSDRHKKMGRFYGGLYIVAAILLVFVSQYKVRDSWGLQYYLFANRGLMVAAAVVIFICGIFSLQL
ncbi:hypothetical protein [Butyricicoccus sp.]|uniref:hypothetical protein n=1 Tax=Butyricicoccus sp. TaxID=2049021 RepID=UPI003F191415